MTNPNPKIVFFATRLYALAAGQSGGYGGAESEMWTVANQFGEDPATDVHVLTLAPDSAITRAPGYEGPVQLSLVAPTASITAASPWLERRRAIIQYFVRLFLAAKNQRAHVYFTKLASIEAATIWLAARFNRAKYMFRIEHDWETNHDDLVQNIFHGSQVSAKIFLYCLKRADVVIVQTKKQQQALQENYGISAVLIPNAHRIPADEIITNDPAKRPIVLWVGRCHSMKRPELYLDLARENEKLPFVMIMPPDDEHKDLYSKCIKQAKAIENLTLIPGVSSDKINDYYQRARVLVLTSKAEGFSNVVIEALKNGAPAVTWDHNPNGILADVADSNHLAPAAGYCIHNRPEMAGQIISALYGESKLWQACHSEARRMAKESFGVESIVDLYADHIEKLARQG